MIRLVRRERFNRMRHHQGGSLRRQWPTANRAASVVRSVLVFLQFAVFLPWGGGAVCVPATGCDTAYAFYRVQVTEDLTSIGSKFGTTQEKIHEVNPGIGGDVNFILTGQPLFIPFKCDCINDQLHQKFPYLVSKADSLSNITSNIYENLSQPNWVASLPSNSIVPAGTYLYIPVNCSCGNPTASPDYGLFLTYPVVAGTGSNISGIAKDFNTSTELLKKFNKDIIWDDSQPTQYAFIPVADVNGNYPPYEGGTSTAGKSSNTGVIVGGVVGGIVIFFVVLALVLYCLCVYQPRKRKEGRLRLADPLFIRSGGNYSSASDPIHSSSSQASSNPRSASFVPTTPGLADYTVDKSVEFSYEELANATGGFSVVNKIGEGGFATVYYGEIRGQKLAIKRMNLQATKEFMAELQVLTHVHHTNLVQLIGYCTTEFLFLVYEFVENGTLDQHLHSSKAGRTPLSWSSRVQIALDAARGLEYIHEHTKPTYIHRDIKSANILLDKECHAKVADFGLTKLTETKVAGAVTQPTRVVGTWGYMSPEYARFGDVSPMVDVYSFGVVLFELLSGREAIMRGALTLSEDFISSDAARPKDEQKALVSFFDPVLKSPNGREKLARFMDPKLGDDYPADAAWKMAQLAGACTQELPSKRPTMRKAVVALMTLSSTTQDWDIAASPKNSSTTATG